MRLKRALAFALSVLFTLALGAALPGKAAKAAWEAVNINGATLNGGTPYGYWDGPTFTTAVTPPATPWQVHLTIPSSGACTLAIRGLILEGNQQPGIEPVAAVTALTISLEGENRIVQHTGESDKPAILCQNSALRITGGGSLSAQALQTAPLHYGIELGGTGSVILDGGAELIAAGAAGAINQRVALDWSKYTVLGGENPSGAGAAELTEAQYNENWATDKYKYLRFIPLPEPPPAPTAVPVAQVPKTGDDTPLMPLAGLALLSAAGLLARALLRRRRAEG